MTYSPPHAAGYIDNFIYSAYTPKKSGKFYLTAKIAKEVICLPLYPDLEERCIDHICALLRGETWHTLHAMS